MIMKGRTSHRPIAYVSFGTFVSVINRLAGRPLRKVLDRKRCGTFSNSTWAQLCGSLRALKLLDERGAPTVSMKSLLVEDHKPVLAKILQENYRELFAADLSRINSARVNQILAHTTGVTGETLRKAVSFFLGAARYCGVQLSSELRSRIRRRSQRSTPTIRANIAVGAARFHAVEAQLSKDRLVSLTANDITLTIKFRRGSLPELRNAEHDLLHYLFNELLVFKNRAAKERARGLTNTNV